VAGGSRVVLTRETQQILAMEPEERNAMLSKLSKFSRQVCVQQVMQELEREIKRLKEMVNEL
jgi:hypothetical protein